MVTRWRWPPRAGRPVARPLWGRLLERGEGAWRASFGRTPETSAAVDVIVGLSTGRGVDLEDEASGGRGCRALLVALSPGSGPQARSRRHQSSRARERLAASLAAPEGPHGDHLARRAEVDASGLHAHRAGVVGLLHLAGALSRWCRRRDGLVWSGSVQALVISHGPGDPDRWPGRRFREVFRIWTNAGMAHITEQSVRRMCHACHKSGAIPRSPDAGAGGVF